MALHTAGPIVVNGATITGSSTGISVPGPITFSRGNYVTVTMPKQEGTHAAASGTRLAGWETVLPPFALQLDHVAMTFGAGSAPQGPSMIVKLWSNGARKGLISLPIAGATTRACISSLLTFTFPASAVARMTVHTVGASAAGGGGKPTLYMRHWS
jgi:hypothetical protein